MILFNNKIVMPTELPEPSFGFDPDKGKIVLRSKDFRVSGKFQVNINNKITNIASGGVLEYTLPAYNKEFPISYIQFSDNNKEYFSKTYNKKIFLNHPDCKYFNYGGEWESSNIIKYIGVNSNIVIPDKHNLISTLSAEILEFPKVTASEITITTGAYMKSFNIKDPRITEFTINCNDFSPLESQFEGLSKLKNINFSNIPTSIPKRMFYGCTSLNLDGEITENFSTIGEYAFYNTPKQKVIRIAASNLEKGVFDYSSNGIQKVIFTSASSVNGLTCKTLPTGTWTKGMLYNTDKKHQIFCDADYSIWPSEPATSSSVTFSGYSTSNQYLSFTTDYRVVGLELKAYSSAGALKGNVFVFPLSTTASTTKPSFSISGTKKTFKCYYTYLYGTKYIYASDEIHVIPITTTGYMDTKYIFKANGTIVGTESNESGGGGGSVTPNNSGLVLHAAIAGSNMKLPWKTYSGFWGIFFSGSSNVVVGVFDSSGTKYPNALRGTPTIETETIYNGTKIYKINIGNGIMYTSYLNSNKYYVRIATSEENLTKESYYIEAQMQVDYSIY